MKITPHVKALTDDLIKLVEGIVVKRPDLAGESEDTILSLETYYTYRDIINGNESLSSYGTLPKEVIQKITSWTKIEYSDNMPAPRNGSGSFVSTNDSTVYYGYDIPKFYAEEGSLYIRKIGTEILSKLYRVYGDSKKFSYDIKVGNTLYHDEIPELEYVSDSGYIIQPYVDFGYMHISKVDANTKDGAGNEYTYVTDTKYIFDELSRKYLVDNSATEDYYLAYYSSGFAYSTDNVIMPIEEEKYISQYDYDNRSIDEHYVLLDRECHIPNGDGTFRTVTEAEMDEILYQDGSENIIHYHVGTIDPIVTDPVYVNGEAVSIIINGMVTNSSTDIYYYFIKDTYGKYIYDGTDYVLYDETNNTNIRYSKKPITDNDVRYRIDGTSAVQDDNGDYIYTCDSVEAYRTIKAVSDAEIDKISHITQLDRIHWESAMMLMKEWLYENYCPPISVDDYRVPLYIGEQNPYYRMLNGLPPVGKESTAPVIDRFLVNPSYTGTDTTPYVYMLTDREIDVLESSGELDKIKSIYNDDSYQYLKYIGRNRIDVIKARDAQPLDILKMGDVENQYHIDLFMNAYSSAKDYILSRYYEPAMFGSHLHYVSYLGFMIVTTAIEKCVAQSPEIVVYDNYLDDETINNILISHGYGDRFKNLPILYRKNIAKNILMLIKYRGTDKIYDFIAKCMLLDEYDVHKYNIYNGENIEVERQSILNGIVDKTNKISFADMIANDSKWKATEESVKALDFDKSSSKYIDVEAYFDLVELSLNNSFVLNYLLDLSKNRGLEIEVPMIGKHNLFDLVTALFAIQAIKLGYSGMIPTIESASHVYRFNIDQAIAGDNEVKDIIRRYQSMLNGISYDNVTHLLSMLDNAPSVYYPDADDTTMRSFGEAYSKTVQEDLPSVNLNENSFYKEVCELKSTCKNITEYQCYEEILDCIAVSSITTTNYMLSNPIWEPIATSIIDGNGNASNTWSYNAYENLPNLLDIDACTGNPSIFTDANGYEYRVYQGGELPDSAVDNNGDSLNDIITHDIEAFYQRITTNDDGETNVILYKRCHSALTYSMYLREECRPLYDKLYEITVKKSYVIDIYDSLLSVSTDMIKVSKEGDLLIIDLGDRSNYTLEDTDTDGDIDIIHLKDGTVLTYEEYYRLLKENVDKIYKLIISAIESLLNQNKGKSNLILSHESAENVLDAFVLLINTFKAYNVDVRDSRIVYKFEEDAGKCVRIFDTIDFGLNIDKKDSIGFKDELKFEIHTEE